MALDTLQHFVMSALFARRPVQLPKFEVSFFVGLLRRKLLSRRLTVERLCFCAVSRSPVFAGGVVYASRRRVALSLSAISASSIRALSAFCTVSGILKFE